MRRVGSVVLVPLFLVGCLTGSGVPDSPSPEVGTGPGVVEYRSCIEHEGFFPVPMEVASARMPEGFQPAPHRVPSNPSGSRPGTVFASEIVVAYACEDHLVDGVSSGEVREVFHALAVVPPDAWRREDAAFHWLLLASVATAPQAVVAYEAWGIGVARVGEVRIVEEPPVGVHRRGSVEGAAGEVQVRMASVVDARDVPPGAGNTGRFFAAAEGRVTGVYDLTWGESSTYAGQFSFEDSITGRQVVGTGRQAAAEGYGYVLVPVASGGASV